jgi:hypothetical protein
LQRRKGRAFRKTTDNKTVTRDRKDPDRRPALRGYQILDTPPDGAFDHIATMAAN